MSSRSLAILFTVWLGMSSPVSADVVTDWNEAMLDAIRVDKTSPPKASRAMAMVQGAVYDAVNAFDRTYTAYHVDVTPTPGASRDAAAAAAAHRVLSQLYPAQQTTFDTRLAASLASVPSGAAGGTALGQQVGDAFLSWRASDGSAAVVSYTPSLAPGRWRPTPPASAAALLPQWGNVTPFGVPSAAALRPAGPPALDSPAYAAAFNEVKTLGSATSATRTAEQTEIALFWADGAGTATPPGHWNEIARDVATARGQGVVENARMFALLNIALADAGIASWDCKYAFDFWRPITAIREAGADGNAATDADSGWSPLIATPPFPEATSGHSTFSGAASTVLASFFGTDDVSFLTGSDGLPGTERAFSSFSEAANEAGMSRIYGGIHFQFSNEQGLASGAQVGDLVSQQLLTPTPEPAGGVFLALVALLAVRRGKRDAMKS